MCRTNAFDKLAKEEPTGLPRRFEEALKQLGKRNEIIITHADKGGGIVILNKSDYNDKIMNLLNDENTYKKKNHGYITNEALKFNKEVRKILSKTPKGKNLLGFLEEAPRPPRMKGLPKIHKPAIPMRPITSGIGSAPHRLAKHLARPLSSLLGKISKAHLRNSNDLIEQLKEINFKDKIMASFDVKSLFTNVPTEGALEATKRALNHINEEDLPINKKHYMELVSICVNFNCFMFENQEYVQHHGLAMGSPLSAVMASLYMESLEEDNFLRIIGRGSQWYRYVDDVLVIVPKNTNLNNKLRRLNSINDNIEFTLEEETNSEISFLDTVIHRQGNTARFSVHRKPTNKDDYIHYLSSHNEKTKTGVVIGFFLRALRICSEEYLDSEFKYIYDAFQKLKYPLGLLRRLKRKATEIFASSRSKKETNYISVPPTRRGEKITKNLSNIGIHIAQSAGKRIADIIKQPKSNERRNEQSVIYRIPCSGCEAGYYGESSRGIEKRIQEHRRDVRLHNLSNALVLHINETNHLPNWGEAEVLHFNLSKKERRMTEAAYITTNKCTNHREGFYGISKATARIIINTSLRTINEEANRVRPSD